MPRGRAAKKITHSRTKRQQGESAVTEWAIGIDIGGTLIMARVTKAATRELSLRPGLAAWALVKAVSLRGHSFAAPIRR